MPLLGGLLVNLFTGVVAWFSAYFSRKVAFGLAAVAGMSSLTLALLVVWRGILVSLNAIVTAPAQIFIDALQMGIPPVASVCLSTYMTLWTACTVYTWQRDLLHLFAKT